MRVILLLFTYLAFTWSFQLPSTPGFARQGWGRFNLKASSQEQKPDQSWNLGRFFKTFVTFNGLPFLPPKTIIPQQTREDKGVKVLWDFSVQDQSDFQQRWAPLDDVVMGGLSVSNIVMTKDGNARVEGVTSSGNNGGFCSARTRNVEPPFDVTGFKGVAMRAKSDKALRYKLILRDSAGWDTIAWCYSFDLPADKWVDVRVKFSDMIPVVRGSTISTRPFNAASLYSVQIMLSKYEYDGKLNPKFTEGPFALDFGSIGVYK